MTRVQQAPAPVTQVQPVPPRRWLRVIAAWPYLLVGGSILFNLWTLRAERLSVSHPNDSAFHLALVEFARKAIEAHRWPFGAWFPNLNLGVAFFHEYQTLPHILVGLVSTVVDTRTAFQWTLYLGFCTWPLSVYLGTRMLGWERRVAAAAALVSTLVTSASLFGFERQSYTWRGYGLWAQLFGMWLLPLALGATWRALRDGRGYVTAALLLGLTCASHFITGYIAMVALVVWVLVTPKLIWQRLRRALLVGVTALAAIAFIVVPLLVDGRWIAWSTSTRGSFFTDSFGAVQILRWLFTGDLFDFRRFPVLSILVGVGFVVCVARAQRDERSRAALGFFLASLVLFFGRRTFGSVADVLPFSRDLHMHRFVAGVHMGGIILAGVGAAWIGDTLQAAASRRRASWGPIVAVLWPLTLIALLLPAFVQVGDLAQTHGQLIRAQQVADRTDGAKLDRLLAQVRQARDGRVYSGGLALQQDLPYAVGGVSTFLVNLEHDANGVGYAWASPSLMADVESRFDPTNPDHYDLFNVRYVLLPKDIVPPVPATLVASSGRHRLYKVDTTGYFEVVDTVSPAIRADAGTMGRKPAAFLRSPLLKARQFPTIAYDGDPAAKPSLPPGATADGPAGTVVSQHVSRLGDRYSTVVEANRPAVVLLKESYHPRWKATVDGKPVKTQIVAPGLIGVPVTAGRHEIEVRYHPFRGYVVLLLVGAAALIACSLVGRRRPRSRSLDDELSARTPTS